MVSLVYFIMFWSGAPGVRVLVWWGVVWLSYLPRVLTVFIGYGKSYFRFIGGLIIM